MTSEPENEALTLKPEARAELAEKLLRSLEELSEKEIERLRSVFHSHWALARRL